MKSKIFTLADVRKVEEEAMRRGARIGTNNAIDAMMACTSLTLMDKFGFTAEQLREFVEWNNKEYDAINNGAVSIEDIKQTCIEEFGIEFREV